MSVTKIFKPRKLHSNQSITVLKPNPSKEYRQQCRYHEPIITDKDWQENRHRDESATCKTSFNRWFPIKSSTKAETELPTPHKSFIKAKFGRYLYRLDIGTCRWFRRSRRPRFGNLRDTSFETVGWNIDFVCYWTTCEECNDVHLLTCSMSLRIGFIITQRAFMLWSQQLDIRGKMSFFM